MSRYSVNNERELITHNTSLISIYAPLMPYGGFYMNCYTPILYKPSGK